MAVKIYYQEDCNMSLLEDKTIAIIGYGSQGHAHALNMREANPGRKLRHRASKYILRQRPQNARM